MKVSKKTFLFKEQIRIVMASAEKAVGSLLVDSADLRLFANFQDVTAIPELETAYESIYSQSQPMKC